MSQRPDPVSIDLTPAQVTRLKRGETVEVVLTEEGDRTDKLEIRWNTVIESDGAAQLHDELTDIFNGETPE